jgi:hypothetical protein
MHDIGRLGLLVAYPEEYERVISNAADQCLDVLDFEAEEFGMHHAEAGRMLAERWGLPEEFAIITGRHHDPSEGSEVDLLRIVHVGCRFADVLGYDFVRPLVQVDTATVLAELPARARERLQMTPAELCSRIEAQILAFDSTKTDLPTETSLAFLASSMEETSKAATGTAAPDPVAAQPTAPRSPDEQAWARKNRLGTAVAASALVIILVAEAVLIWKLM